MPLVFVIARDWKLRSNVRAELRERWIEALGMESPSDARQSLACSGTPSALVLEGTVEITGDPWLRDLARRVPTVVVLSRIHPELPFPVAATLFRPVRIGNVVTEVMRVLAGVPA